MRNNTHLGSCDAPGTADPNIGAVTTAIKTLEHGGNVMYRGAKKGEPLLFFNLFKQLNKPLLRVKTFSFGVSPKIRKPSETPGGGFFSKHHASVGNGSGVLI